MRLLNKWPEEKYVYFCAKPLKYEKFGIEATVTVINRKRKHWRRDCESTPSCESVTIATTKDRKRAAIENHVKKRETNKKNHMKATNSNAIRISRNRVDWCVCCYLCCHHFRLPVHCFDWSDKKELKFECKFKCKHRRRKKCVRCACVSTINNQQWIWNV